MGCTPSKSRNEQEVGQQSSQYRAANQITDNEVVILKVKMLRDKVLLNRNDLQKRVDANMVKIRDLARQKRKDEAMYYLGVKKSLQERLKGVSSKLEFIEKRIHTIESVQDDAEFTALVKQSNDVLNNLMQQVNVDALREAKELDEQVNLNNQQVIQIIGQSENDPEIMEEYARLGNEGAQVVGVASLNNKPLQRTEIGMSEAQNRLPTVPKQHQSAKKTQVTLQKEVYLA